jgi:hypothetical protein
MRLSRAQLTLLRQMADSDRPLMHCGYGWCLNLPYPAREVDPSRATVRALLDRDLIVFSDEPLNKVQIHCGMSAAVLTDAGREAAGAEEGKGKK